MNTKITLVELARLMAQSTSTTSRVCELFLRELFATVSQALINGESVKIKGIGTFKVITVKPRKSVSVSTGNPTEIKSHNKVTFTPDKNLAEALNQPFAQFETVFLNDEVSDEKLAEIDEQYPSFLCDETEPLEPAPIPDPASFPEPEFIPQAVTKTVSASPAKEDNKPEPAAESASQPEQHLDSLPEKEPSPIEEKEPVGKKALAAFGAPIEPEKASESIKESQEPPVEKTVEKHLEIKQSQPSTTVSKVDVPETKPQPEEEEDDGFHRPAPRNTYTPTQEQISRHQSNKNRRKLWSWILLAALVLGVLCWLLTRGGGKADSDQQAIAMADSDSVAAAVAEPAVITDTVTSKIVLSTLSDKYYDSPWFWVYIYEENKAIINDPNNVPPGTAVVIPPAEKYGIDANDPASLKKAQRRSWEILTQGKR